MNNMQMIESVKTLVRQFVKFGAVGVINTLLFYVFFLVLSSFVAPLMGYYIAYLSSMVIAVFLHLRYTFEQKATYKKVGLFIGIYVATMLLGGVALDLIIGLGVAVWLAGLITVGIVVVSNFVCFKAAAKWA